MNENRKAKVAEMRRALVAAQAASDQIGAAIRDGLDVDEAQTDLEAKLAVVAQLVAEMER